MRWLEIHRLVFTQPYLKLGLLNKDTGQELNGSDFGFY